jgi:hypothetical protein
MLLKRYLPVVCWRLVERVQAFASSGDINPVHEIRGGLLRADDSEKKGGDRERWITISGRSGAGSGLMSR